MTTPAAAALYEAQHVQRHEGLRNAVFNPHGRPPEELPAIFGFNNGGSPGWMSAELLTEDGTHLGGHVCSSEAYMPADLGVIEGTREDLHEKFRKHYPSGYRMEFVRGEDVGKHQGLEEACRRHQEKAQARKLLEGGAA